MMKLSGKRQMNPVYRIPVLTVIALSTGLSATRSNAKAESGAEKIVQDNFEVSWSEITYNKRLALRNPAVSRGQGRELSETLSLSCEITILDPNRVLGVCREPIIEEIAYGRAKTVATGPLSPGSGDMKYDFLRYRRRHVRAGAKWENALRSALGLPRKVSSRPKWFKELQPSRMQIELDARLSRQANNEIGRVKGHFYALVAESLECVEVPFEPSDDWVRLTPDMEVRVGRASCQESEYTLSVTERPNAAGSTPALYLRSYLPDRLVVARYLVGPDDKPIRHPLAIRSLPDSLNDPGEAARGSGVGRIKKIRFVIAVNLTHHKIPFVLENIPLPKP